jgi:hypothetical protein
MALRLHLYGLPNAAGQVVEDRVGTLSGLALPNDSSADAEPIGAPKPGPRFRRDAASGGLR